MVTWSSSSHRPRVSLLRETTAQVVSGQELHVVGEGVADLEREVHALGWSCAVTAAVPTQSGSVGGVGIFVKRCVVLLRDVAVPVEGRAVLATAAVVGGTSFTLASLYLLTGGRICDFNAEVLARTAAEVGARGAVVRHRGRLPGVPRGDGADRVRATAGWCTNLRS